MSKPRVFVTRLILESGLNPIKDFCEADIWPDELPPSRAEILAQIRAWAMAQPSVKACLAALDAVQVPCAKVQGIDEVLADPQIIARGMVVEQDHPVLGRIRLPNLPFRFSECDTSPKSVAPLMGQHNREIAGALGYPAGDIDAMERDGVLYAEEAVARLAAAH